MIISITPLTGNGEDTLIRFTVVDKLVIIVNTIVVFAIVVVIARFIGVTVVDCVVVLAVNVVVGSNAVSNV
jgi:hypothetical protein